ncbi:nascent polypeptide-associated complex subunit alpha, muscle-specific form-like [Sander lucioperca]|uniref:nascent polypeptide-associated complex subunit alpha, muscle-specific form-like n=1 Tax=Sander lucioperca TaxID=283035 RepID=UPI0016539D16|nr:nascent polypeptide-associated complex subunit alpha, muscle-specific form-like [Sander lucioperca]
MKLLCWAVIVLSKPGRKENAWVSEVLAPRCQLTDTSKKCLERMKALYELVIQGWTPQVAAGHSSSPVEPPTTPQQAPPTTHVAVARPHPPAASPTPQQAPPTTHVAVARPHPPAASPTPQQAPPTTHVAVARPHPPAASPTPQQAPPTTHVAVARPHHPAASPTPQQAPPTTHVAVARPHHPAASPIPPKSLILPVASTGASQVCQGKGDSVEGGCPAPSRVVPRKRKGLFIYCVCKSIHFELKFIVGVLIIAVFPFVSGCGLLCFGDMSTFIYLFCQA